MPNQAKSFVKHDIESKIMERSPAHGMGSWSTHHLLSTADASSASCMALCQCRRRLWW
jgi:hypothetical protein